MGIVDIDAQSAVRASGVAVRDGSTRDFKRIIDVIVALSAVILAAPLMAAVAVAIVIDSGRPVFFRQTRRGYRGREFTMTKFRSLRAGCVASLDLAALNEAGHPLFKIKIDPRATRVGSLLRRTGLDELPQLWDVLRGDMALVGPRPLIPSEADALPFSAQALRTSCRPGITGVWQLTENRHQDVRRMIDADSWYLENRTLLLDLRILFMTLLRKSAGLAVR